MERLLLLLPNTTYRTQAFVDAARDLGVDLVCATDQPSTLEAAVPDHLLTLEFGDPDRAAARVAEWTRFRPVRAVVAVDDQTTVAAAAIAARLGLVANSVAATRAARDKAEMHRILSESAVPVPRFRVVPLDQDPTIVASHAMYPCVLKPLTLSASRGVIRANSDVEFLEAFARIGKILRRDDVSVTGDAARFLLVEEYLPGDEVALEGLLMGGELHTLALFDKPDPLEGPFFEETIYVTPSTLPDDLQGRIASTAAKACAALGLSEGPIHAELRLNDRGVFVLEVAARSIGGLCSRTIRFGTGMSLEGIILRHALGWPIDSLARERRPAGVMMIPIPRGGKLVAVHGREAALAVASVEDVTITAHIGQELVPLPEGSQYLGFIFACAGTPEATAKALREAHAQLAFDVS